MSFIHVNLLIYARMEQSVLFVWISTVDEVNIDH